MNYLPRTQRQIREIDFYLQVQEASMKVETEGKTYREKQVDGEIMEWVKARERVKWEGFRSSETGRT